MKRPTLPDSPRCTVCGAVATREASFRDVVLHRCGRCDHCFTDVDALEHLAEYDAAWEAMHPNWFANPHVALFERIARLVDGQGDAPTVVDIGMGRGELLEYLGKRCPRATLTGIDLALQPDVEGVELLVGDFLELDLGDRRWDVAVSLATIEHVADVRGFARRMHELLRPGGLAIVMTVDDRSILYAVARLLNRVGYHTAFERLYDRFHLNHFTSRSLRTLFGENGFDPVEQLHHNVPIRSVDMPTSSAVALAGVWGTFALGRLTGRTYEQTLVAAARQSSANSRL